MQPYQLEFYKNLIPSDQMILKAAALKANFNATSELVELLSLKTKSTPKSISLCIEQAVRYKLIELPTRYYYGGKYKASVAFLIFIFPELKQFKHEWELVVKKRTNYNSTESIVYLRDFLYALLYQPFELEEAERALLSSGALMELTGTATLFDYPIYQDLIKKINYSIIVKLFQYKLSETVESLNSLNELKTLADNLNEWVDEKNRGMLPFYNSDLEFYSGNFEASIIDFAGQSMLYSQAIHAFTQGDLQTSLVLFDKGIKIERTYYKGIHLPTNPFHSIYYLALLLCIEQEVTALRFHKFSQAIQKNSYDQHDPYFQSVADNFLNNTADAKLVADSMFSYVKLEHNNFQSLLFICLGYLADAKPPMAIQKAMALVVGKAMNQGFLSLAYEAAYAMKCWFNNESANELFNAVAKRMSYAPAFSQIVRQAEWEKSLTALMNLGSEKSGKSAKDKEGAARVIYLFDPKSNNVQPISQTRSVKDVWSAGRNIALKTFFDGKTLGMTEQDLRISKTIKHYNSYYDGNYHAFTERAVVELIGHPFIFLAGGKEIPVEFLSAQPEVKVVKSAAGYKIQIDVRADTQRVFVEKETNTRYKVYDLTLHQLDLIRVLSSQNILVPEQGKEKLTQLLGGISKHATIHTDLLSTNNQNGKIKTVQADNRLRVQLLPFGTGLKAEIFAKPFGTHPPYCKPGVGGKVLIANENGTQLQVKRNLKQEEEISNSILADLQALESINLSDDLIAFDEPLDSLNLLDVIAQHKEKCVVEWPEGERFKIKGTASFGNLSMRIKSKTNWFELDGELKVNEDTVLTLQQLMAMVAKSHGRFIELKDGEFLALSAEMKKRLEELYTFTTKGKDGLQMNKFASVALGDFFEDVENLKTDKAWKEFRQRVERVEVAEVKIPTTLQAELRPYQEEGFRWMTRLAEWEGGACLADDMGLGKTIQTLTILLHRSTAGASMVVCPVSVIGNWVAEAQRFAPTLNIKTLGISNRAQTLESLEAGDLLITSYGLIQSEEKLFVEKEFGTIVLDEAHVIKNFATKTSKVTMQLKASFRVALTGTPLQNHLGEIWNLFNFVNPGLLGTMQHFNDTFVKPDNEHARKYLRKLIAPFILRRTKAAVLDELPAKTEIVKKIQLSESEMAYYEALRRQALLNLESSDGNQGSKQLQVLAEITKLRQASCNPALVDPNINIPSSKMAAFLEIVDELIENKHRALVFSQFVKHLSLMRAALDLKGIKYQYLDGSTPIPEREKSVKRFQGGEGELFLISLKAGGLGLNLTAADYVIHLDPWWNPAIEDQASDRAHRIGQTRPVTIYRLVAENTIEEKIIQLHNTKRDLADSLLEGSDQSARMSMNELVSLIQEGF